MAKATSPPAKSASGSSSPRSVHGSPPTQEVPMRKESNAPTESYKKTDTVKSPSYDHRAGSNPISTVRKK